MLFSGSVARFPIVMDHFDLIKTPLQGRNLIEASAGTGKTFTIAAIYLRLLLERQLPVEQILVVTFTEAATKELRERIRQRLLIARDWLDNGTGDADPLMAGIMAGGAEAAVCRRLLTSALRGFDQAAIHTIHGFCQRMLQDNPFESGSLFDTELVTDQQPLLAEIAADFWRINCYGASPQHLEAAVQAGLGPDSLLKLARGRGAAPFLQVIPDLPMASYTAEPETWILSLKRAFFAFLEEELPRRKQRANVRFFEDLLLDLHSALAREGSPLPRLIRDRYRAALVDEFQDTDPLQFGIFDAIYPAGNPTPFFLIGDPKQAIYSFRGADIFAYMAAASATANQHTLGENWRSEPALIRAVNTIFASRGEPFLFPEIRFRPVAAAAREQRLLTLDGAADPAPFRLWFAGRNDPDKPINKGDAWEVLPEAVADEIDHLLGLGREGRLRIGETCVTPGDMAVLVRANRQARLIRRALRRKGIPAVLCRGGNLFETAEAGELLRILAAVAEPSSEKLLRAALATDLVGVSGNELSGLLAEESAWEKVLEEFRHYHGLWEASGCMTMMLHLLAARQVRSRLLSLPGGERRVTNILHCCEILHRTAAERNLGMEGVTAWLSERIAEKKSREEYEIRLETDEQAVQIVTIHKSKGLEYPIVFAPFCWAEFGGTEEAPLCHDAEGRPLLDLGSSQISAHRHQERQETLAESLRLLYVALTRSRNRCYLAWGAFKDAGGSAMHYLLHPEGAAAKGQVASGDPELLRDLDRLVRDSGGAIGVTPLPGPSAGGYISGGENTLPAGCRTFSGAIDHEWRVSSFTFLAGQRESRQETPDRDEAGAPSTAPSAPDRPASGIFAFPRGAAAGIFFHELLETLDFTAPPERLTQLATTLLHKHGFAAEWLEPVCTMVRGVLKTPLPSPDGCLTLDGIAPERRLAELEFFFPLERLTPQRLGGALARWSGEALPLDLPGLLSRLSFNPVRGFMRGFIDLVFRQGGRFYIVDWKSNHLGNSPQDYAPDSLKREMTRHLYPLQYLLYTVALDRYLALRVADYSYDAHFGGVYYLFLRGMGGDGAEGYGVHYDRPPRELVAELAAALLGT